VLKIDGAVVATLPAGDVFGFQVEGPNTTLLEVIPQTVTITPSAVTGTEGTPIALNFSVDVGPNTQLDQLIVGNIPAGATLSDDQGHSFTVTNLDFQLGLNSYVVNNGWDTAHLFITAPSDANFALTIEATATNTDNFFSFEVSETEQVGVDPPAPTLSWAATATGVEGVAISLGNLTYGITNGTGDSNSLASLTIAGVPKGATLEDGTHSIVSDGSTPIDVVGWTLSSLKVQTVNDSNFTLTATAVEKDGDSPADFSAPKTASEVVTVTPEAPAVSWAAGSSVAGSNTVDIGLDVNALGLTGTDGDGTHNSLHSVTISGIPDGAVLSDGGTHSETVSGGTLDVTGWNYADLSITSGAGTFSLTATATEQDSDNPADISLASSATIQVSTSTIDHWKNDHSGDWKTPGAWSFNSPPDSGKQAAIDATGPSNQDYTVTISHGTAAAASALTVDSSHATLSIGDEQGGTLTVGGDVTVNDGTLHVKDDSTMNVGGDFTVHAGFVDVWEGQDFGPVPGGVLNINGALVVDGGEFELQPDTSQSAPGGGPAGTLKAASIDVKTGGTVDLEGHVNVSGPIDIDGGNLTVGAGATFAPGSTETVTFTANGGTLTYTGAASDQDSGDDDIVQVPTAVAGFGPGDKIDLSNLAFNQAYQLHLNYSANVGNNTGTLTFSNDDVGNFDRTGASINFADSVYKTRDFVVVDDGHLNAETGKDGTEIEWGLNTTMSLSNGPYGINSLITATVTVTNLNGQGVQGVTVHPVFTVDSGGGEGAWQFLNGLNPPNPVVTNSQGKATFSFNPRDYAGTYTITAVVDTQTLSQQVVVQPGPAYAPLSSLTAVLDFAGPQETALLTLVDTDQKVNPRSGDAVTWSGSGTFSPGNNAPNDVTDANGMLVDTFAPTSDTPQTVTASFDGVSVQTTVNFIAMDTWINTGGGVWGHTSDNGNTNWSSGVPTAGEAVWIGNDGTYTVDVTQPESIYGIGSIATATLKLDSTFTVTGSGDSVLSGALIIDNGAEFLAKNGEVDLNGAVTNNSTLQVQDGALVQIAGGIAGTGNIVVDGGHLNVQGAVAATQAITIEGAGVVHLAQAEGGSVTFSGAGLLALDAAPALGMTVHNFGSGDSIDLTNLTYSSGATLNWDQASDTLTVNNGSTSESIHFGEAHSASDFVLEADPLGSGGTDIVYANPALNYSNAVSDSSPAGSTGLVAGGINNMGVALFSKQTIAGDTPQYFYFNGHLIQVSGAPTNDSPLTALNTNGFWSPEGGINESQQIALTLNTSLGDGPATYLGKVDSSTDLFVGAGGTTSSVNNGPTQLQSNSSPHFTGEGLGINDAGQIVGYFEHQGQTLWYGVISNPGSTPSYIIVDVGNTIGATNATTYSDHLSGIRETVLTGINNHGIAVGYYEVDQSQTLHAFIFNSNDGAFTLLPDLGGNLTVATGINDQGIVVGYSGVTDAIGEDINGDAAVPPSDKSFVYAYNDTTDTGQYLTTNFSTPDFHSSSSSGIELMGINNNGQVVGDYTTSGPTFQPFVASLNPVVTVDNGGTLYVNTQNSNTIHFAGPTGEIVFDDPTTFHGVITGFTGSGPSPAQSDTIDVVGYNVLDFFSNSYHAQYFAGSGLVTIADAFLPTVGFTFQGFSGSMIFVSDGHGGTLIYDPPSGAAAIAGGEIFEVTAADNGTVTFTGATGVLQLDDPQSFSGHIAGFTGTAADAAHSDVVDLGGVDFNSANFVESYHAATGELSVTDGSHSANITFDNFQGALDFASDGHGGTAITDAPADAAANPLSTATAQGTLSFADNDAATDLSVSVTPDGQNYVGNLTTGAVTESNGTAAVDYGFALGNDQINVAPGQTVTQSYQVSLADAQNPAANATQTVAVTIGGAGNDNFVFAPGVGHDTVLNFNAQQDTVELDHFANAQTVQELQSLITADTHGNAVLDLGNHDSITFLNTTQAQLQQAVQNGHVLLQ
jgi:hypothetical protein